MARSKRIQYLAELSKGYNRVLDIGTDHGFVLEIAFKNNWIKSAIATDLREKPLNQAKKHLKDYPVEYVISDGFEKVNQDFDLAIIAGMGSYLICDILDKAPLGDQIYLLQANEKIEILRAYLMNHGFSIIDEFITFDKFFYVILKVQRGQMILNEDELYLGPKLMRKPEAIPYYEKKASQIAKIMAKTDENRRETLEKTLKIYKNI